MILKFSTKKNHPMLGGFKSIKILSVY